MNSKIPLYYQLENVLREKINSGAYSGGDPFPTEHELLKQYQVSRITVRQALKSLAEDGLIERRQGRGTFVSDRKTIKRKFSEITHLNGSLDELISMGQETCIKVLEMNRVEADLHEADLLHLKVGTPVYRLKRLRIHEDKPFGVVINYFPEEIGFKLDQSELSSPSLLYIIENKIGFQLKNARQEIKAELSDPSVAKLLEIPVGTALLSLQRTVFSISDTPVEFVHSLYRSDIYGYSLNFNRD